jgi:intracellular multiplication protein IcmK
MRLAIFSNFMKLVILISIIFIFTGNFDRVFADVKESAGQRFNESQSRDDGSPAYGAHPANDADAEREMLFNESLEQLLPLKPEEVRKFKNRRESLELAIEPGPARMNTQTRQIHITPGAVPQVIRLTAGYSSTLVFQDSTGAPWPVLSMILGAAKAFEVTQPKVEQETITESQASRADSVAVAKAQAQVGGQSKNVQSNIINIVPLTNHASSNLVVTLEGAPYPVILHLLTESSAKETRIADALVVFRLDKAGPHANLPQLEPSGVTTITPEMLSIVHGVPPRDAASVPVDPRIPGVALYDFKGRYYLRTSYAAVWPAWTSSVQGEDVRVYIMPKTPSIVVSIGGKLQKLVVGGK